jgi:hypothetical protein
MKLSDAIRDGSSYHPQNFHTMKYDGKTCTLSAAMIGVGLLGSGAEDVVADDWHDAANKLVSRYPCLREEVLDICYRDNVKKILSSLLVAINFRNVAHMQTRGTIADWIDTLNIDQEEVMV